MSYALALRRIAVGMALPPGPGAGDDSTQIALLWPPAEFRGDARDAGDAGHLVARAARLLTNGEGDPGHILSDADHLADGTDRASVP